MKKFYFGTALFTVLSVFTAKAQTTISTDIASNYTTETWGQYGSQGGTGYTHWQLWVGGANPEQGDHVIDSSVGHNFGNVDTNGTAFGIYGTGSSEAVIYRYFVGTGAPLTPNQGDSRAPMLPGQIFSINIAVEWRNGYKGFDLLTSNGAFLWNFGVNDNSYHSGDEHLFNDVYIPGSVFNITAYQLANNTYKVKVTRGSEVWESEILTGTLGGFKFYCGNATSDNILNRLYFNNLTITQCPEVTVWDGENWSNGEPAIYKSVVINNNYTSTTSISACSLTVADAAEVTIKAGHTLTVTNNIDVEAGSELIIESNAALVQIAENAANTGSITVKRNSNALYRQDYTLWGSPVGGQQLGAFSAATVSNRFYTYAYNWNAAASPALYREMYWNADPAQNFEPGVGYLIRMPNTITEAEAILQSGTEGMPIVTVEGYNTLAETNSRYIFPGVFTGSITNGTVNVPLTVADFNPDAPAENLSQAGHYVAVANPYASPVSVSDFFTQNSNVLEAGEGIYFWRKKNNATTSSYSCLTMAAYVENEADGGSAGDNSQYYQTPVNNVYNSGWIISPGQGFIVKTKESASANSTIVFTNSMRRQAPAAGQPFFKTMDNNAAEASKWWLNLTNAQGKFSQAAVAYMPQATVSLDFGLDGRAIEAGTIALYTLAEESTLSIQARPQFEATDAVPLGFTASVAGEYTLTLDHTEGVFSTGQAIYLQDNLTGVTVSLASSYSFTTAAGTFNNRFTVVYTTSALDTQNPQLQNQVMVYAKNNTLNINSGSLQMTGVTLYDLQGRRLYAQTGINGTATAIANLNIAHQVLIVSIDTVNGKVSKKIVY